MRKKLSAIEAKLGKRLFNRSIREFSPTEDGDKYVHFATEILDRIDSFDQNSSCQVEPSGVIKLAASTSFARLFLVPAFKEFLSRYPKIKIDLVVSDQITDIINEGLDIAIRIAPLRDSTLISKRIGSGRKAVCCGSQYIKKFGLPKTSGDPKAYNCIVLGNENNWTFRKAKKEFNIKANGNLKSNYGEMLARSVESGLGIALLALWHAHREIKSGKIVTLHNDFEIANQPEICLVFPDKSYLPTKTRVLIDYLSGELKLPSFKLLF